MLTTSRGLRPRETAVEWMKDKADRAPVLRSPKNRQRLAPVAAKAARRRRGAAADA